MIFQIVLGLAIGLVLFIATIKAYILGLKHGKQLGQGDIPKIEINPIKPIIEAIEAHKNKPETDGLEEIMSFSMESALEAIKKEKKVI